MAVRTRTHKELTCKTFLVLLASALILSMMITVVPWVQPNGGLWLDIAWATHPLYEQVELPGLDGEVQIVRDSWGVPHIYATTLHDLALACGYVHAQDRLFQMDLYRRLAQGRLAEIAGPDYIESDIFYRSLRLDLAAARSYNQMPLDVQDALDAYADGVNHYMSRIGFRVPLELRVLGYPPESWTPLDSLLLERLLAWMLSGSPNFKDLDMALLVEAFGNDTVWGELFPTTRYNDVPVTPTPLAPKSVKEPGEQGVPYQSDEELPEAVRLLVSRYRRICSLTGLRGINQLAGSNCWVVNGSLTASGAPLLCCDLHLPLTLPTFWYEVHLVAPGLNVRGVTFPGFPFPLVGFNEHLAWGFTAMAADTADFYYYNWNPSNPDQYWWQGSWRKINQTSTTLYARVNRNLVPLPLLLNSTVHGPLLQEEQGRLALKWAGSNGSRAAEAYLRMAQATDYAQFAAALPLLDSPALNVLYADVHGTIAYHAVGSIPIRSPGDGPLPLNGSSGGHEWLGIIPSDQLPSSFNPPGGILVSANQRPVNETYPYYLGYAFTPAHRAKRIIQLLNATEPLTSTHMRRIQLDSYSPSAAALAPLVASIVLNATNPDNDPTLHAAASRLQSWNYYMDTESVAATIWSNFLTNFQNATFHDEYAQAGLPEEAPYPDAAILENFTLTNYPRWFNDTTRSGTQTRDQIILQAFTQTVESLIQLLGPDPDQWQYGRTHVLWIRHTMSPTFPYLDAPHLPINGSQHTINYAPGYLSSTLASWRQIVDLADPQTSLGVLPGGQSSNPYSPHYLDQLTLWVTGQYHTLTIPQTPEGLPDPEATLHLTPAS